MKAEAGASRTLVSLDVLERLEAAVGRYSGEGFLPDRSWYLASRASQRAHQLGLEDLASYVRYVEDHPAEELPRLWKLLRVGHTGWMRHPAQLEAVVQVLSGRRNLRLWSAGCGTGQEVYSLAALLLERGRGDFSILGTDLCQEALAVAEAGRYPLEASPPVTLRRWLLRGKTGWRVRAAVRKRCRFLRHNLLKTPPLEQCDAVLCRNVLLYFAPATVQRVVQSLLRATAPGGLLVVAPQETSLLEGAHVERLRVGDVTLFRKPAGPETETEPQRAPASEGEGTMPSRRRLVEGVFRDGDLAAMEALLERWETEGSGDLVLDLDGVTYLSDAAARPFRALARRLEARGSRLRLAATRPGVRRWIRRNGLGDLEESDE